MVVACLWILLDVIFTFMIAARACLHMLTVHILFLFCSSEMRPFHLTASLGCLHKQRIQILYFSQLCSGHRVMSNIVPPVSY